MTKSCLSPYVADCCVERRLPCLCVLCCTVEQDWFAMSHASIRTTCSYMSNEKQDRLLVLNFTLALLSMLHCEPILLNAGLEICIALPLDVSDGEMQLGKSREMSYVCQITSK